MATPVPEFTALSDIPAYLGHAAHSRLEELLEMPVASDDAHPEVANEQTGQRGGVSLGDMIGREREFTRNLPQIKANFAEVAERRGVSEAALWDNAVEILAGSGIGQAMHRTLDRPVGGSYGA